MDDLLVLITVIWGHNCDMISPMLTMNNDDMYVKYKKNKLYNIV